MVTKTAKQAKNAKGSKATTNATPTGSIETQATGSSETQPETQAMQIVAPKYLVETQAKGITWPLKSRSGNSIRAYCYQCCVQAQKQYPKGFTIAQVATIANANQKQGIAAGFNLGLGFGAPGVIKGRATQHFTWFAGTAQGWLQPVNAPSKGSMAGTGKQGVVTATPTSETQPVASK